MRYAYRMMTLFALLSLILPVGVHDDDFLTLTYAGAWTVVHEPLAYGSFYMQTNAGSLSFTFMGDSFGVYGIKTPSGGSAEVCVDDMDCVVVDWLGEISRTTEIVSISGLPNATHSVTITAIEDGNITIDAIYIAPTAPAPLETPAYLEYNADETGVFENRITSGDQSLFIVLVALLVVSLSGLLLQIWRGGQ